MLTTCSSATLLVKTPRVSTVKTEHVSLAAPVAAPENAPSAPLSAVGSAADPSVAEQGPEQGSDEGASAPPPPALPAPSAETSSNREDAAGEPVVVRGPPKP